MKGRWRVTREDRDLAGFSPEVKQKTFLLRALWVAIGDPISRSVFCPRTVRVQILRLFGATIGSGVVFRHGVRVHWPWNLKIGDNSWVGVGTWILNLELVSIGKNVCISQDVLLCTGSHRADDPEFGYDNAPITVCDGAWIAIRATVLRGVTIGEGAVVGATSLVTTNVGPNQQVLPPRANQPRWKVK